MSFIANLKADINIKFNQANRVTYQRRQLTYQRLVHSIDCGLDEK